MNEDFTDINQSNEMGTQPISWKVPVEVKMETKNANFKQVNIYIHKIIDEISKETSCD